MPIAYRCVVVCTQNAVGEHVHASHLHDVIIRTIVVVVEHSLFAATVVSNVDNQCRRIPGAQVGSVVMR